MAKRSLENQERSTKPKSVKASLTAIAAGGALALAACAPDDEQATPDISPKIETSAPDITVPTVEAYPVSAEKYTTPEQISDEFTQMLESWYNAGANPENSHRAYRGDRMSWSIEDFANEIADENAAIFANAMLPAGWQDDSGLVNLVSEIRKTNFDTVRFYLLTNGSPLDNIKSSDPNDIEAYKLTASKSKVVSSEFKDGNHTLIVTKEEKFLNNSDSNSFGQGTDTRDPIPHGFKATVTETYKLQKDGTWKMVNRVALSGEAIA